MRKEVKPVASEKFDFIYRDRTIVLAFYGIYGPTKFRPRAQT